MQVAAESPYQAVIRWGWLGPSLALGLFAGRFISELLRPGLIGAVITALLCLLFAVLAIRRVSILVSWPSLFLLAYVFYPEPDPRIALIVALFTVSTIMVLNYKVEGASIDRPGLLLIALLVGLVYLGIYAATLARDVLPADNGELQLVAADLGVAHPPGFALYTLVISIFSRIFSTSTPAYVVNFFSALTSAATLVFIFLAVYELAESLLGSIIATSALGTATTYWAQATTANVRSLTALFAAMAFYSLITYRHRYAPSGIMSSNGMDPSEEKSAFPGFGLIVFFLISISFGITHHPSLIFISAILFAALVIINPKLVKMHRFWLAAGAALILALLPLIYLPIRAAANARGTTEELLTISGFLEHVLALGFRGDLFFISDPALFLERLRIMTEIFVFQFSPFLLLGIITGLVLLAINDWKMALLLAITIAVYIIVAAVYRAPQTVEYMMPAYIPCTLALGYGIGCARKQAITPFEGGRSFLLRAAAAVYVSAIMVAVVINFFNRLPSFQQIRDDSSTRDFVENIFDDAPADSIVLADWHWATPMWYLQTVEKQRPDLDIRYVFPTGEPYADTWARRIQEELLIGKPVVSTHYDESGFANLPPFEPLGDAFLFPQVPRLTLPEGYSSLDLTLGERVEVLGYQISNNEVAIGDELIATVAWRPITEELDITHIFGQLEDSKGLIIGNDDQILAAPVDGINLSQLRLVPRPGASPGNVQLLIGAYGDEPLLDSDDRFRTPIAELSIIPAKIRPFTNNPIYRDLVDAKTDKRLIGYDRDNTIENSPRLYLHWQVEDGYISEPLETSDLPFEVPPYFGPWGIPVRGKQIDEIDDVANYVPLGSGIIWTGPSSKNARSPEAGETFTEAQNFRSTRPIFQDLVVSVRLVGYEDDGFHWDWWDLQDSVPALGAIPTLKWIGDTWVRDPHRITVSESATPGQQIRLLLRLYDAFTQRPVSILDDRISEQNPWITIGNSQVSSEEN